MVEDEDGFEIPMAQTDVVVVGEESYDTGRMVQAQTLVNVNSTAKKAVETAEEKKSQPQPQTQSAPAVVEERKGGNMLSVYIAYVPLDEKNISQCQFESYLVNDSNYFLMYSILMSDNNSWTLLHQGEIEPNTKEFIREVGRDEINALSKIEVQLIAYKKNKPFLLKSPIETQLRIDPVKFFKLHTFRENDFFEQAALLYSIVENDKVTRPIVIDTKLIQESLSGGKAKEAAKPKPVLQKRKGDEDVVVVDLHADHLLDTTEGMTSSDILSYQLEVFRRTIAEYKNKQGQRLIFIHGKGEGVLRHALINDLNYRYKKYTYQDASFQEYQYGATQVTIK